MLDKLSHITLTVKDVQASEKFFKEQLGFKVQYRCKKPEISCIELGGQVLKLQETDRDGTIGEISFCFELDSRERFDHEVSGAAERGAELISAVEEIEGGKVRASFRGVNGERIVVTGPDARKDG